jgi:dephospho-CoA kinase
MCNFFNYNAPVYQFLHNRKVWLFAFLLFLPLILPSISKSIIDDYITKLFNDVNKIVLSIGILLLISLAIYSFISKWINKFIISDTLAIFIIIITFWTAGYQFFSDYNYFTCFDLPYLYLTYSVYLIGIFALALLIKSQKKPQSLSKNTNGFLTDMPIKNLDNETLGRKEYAIQIAQKLLEGTYEKAFALGVTGSWGSGKTSFVNLIKDAINKNSKTDKIIIEFNPWNSQNPNQIIEDFFKTFKDKLSPYSSELSSEIVSYAKDLVQNEKGFWGILTTRIINFFDKNDTISEKYDAINETLQKLDKKIIVIIDDLDRLDKKEIIEVIRLIRNTANFYNTSFIVAYDKGYVTNAIGDMNDYQKEYFLEKFFQLEVVLPQVELGNIKTSLANELNKIYSEKKQPGIKINDLINNVADEKSIIENYLSNMRDISRFINSFILNYEMVKGEVVVEEFILLELLRFKYPELVTFLYQSKELFSRNEQGLIQYNQDDFSESLKALLK